LKYRKRLFAGGDPKWSPAFALALIVVLYLYKVVLLTNGLVTRQQR
jgi:antibiotic biosynthesis monooxygenase (ABM) superfamily enzyme